MVRPPRRPKWSAFFSVLAVPRGLLPAAVRVRLVRAAVVPARPSVGQDSLAACGEEQGEGGRAPAPAPAEEGEPEEETCGAAATTVHGVSQEQTALGEDDRLEAAVRAEPLAWAQGER